jgi:hypothetical protein
MIELIDRQQRCPRTKISPSWQKVGPAFDRKVGNGGATQNQIKIQNSPAVKAMNNTAVAAIVNNSSPTSAPVRSELVVIDLPRIAINWPAVHRTAQDIATTNATAEMTPQTAITNCLLLPPPN